jgi:hypothetical protein
MAVPLSATKVEGERKGRARKEVNPVARVQHTNRGFERDRYYRERDHRDHRKDRWEDGGDRRDS